MIFNCIINLSLFLFVLNFLYYKKPHPYRINVKYIDSKSIDKTKMAEIKNLIHTKHHNLFLHSLLKTKKSKKMQIKKLEFESR